MAYDPLTKDIIAMQKSWEEKGNQNSLSNLLGLLAKHISSLEKRVKELEDKK